MTDVALENRLAILNKRGVRFRLEDRKLKYKAEPGQLDADDLAWIRQQFRAIALHCLERELMRVQELYQLCRDFKYSPFPRKLSPACITAGYRALREMEAKMTTLEGNSAVEGVQLIPNVDASLTPARQKMKIAHYTSAE
jgi:hypothetical protein